MGSLADLEAALGLASHMGLEGLSIGALAGRAASLAAVDAEIATASGIRGEPLALAAACLFAAQPGRGAGPSPAQVARLAAFLNFAPGSAGAARRSGGGRSDWPPSSL